MCGNQLIRFYDWGVQFGIICFFDFLLEVGVRGGCFQVGRFYVWLGEVFWRGFEVRYFRRVMGARLRQEFGDVVLRGSFQWSVIGLRFSFSFLGFNCFYFFILLSSEGVRLQLILQEALELSWFFRVILNQGEGQVFIILRLLVIGCGLFLGREYDFGEVVFFSLG